MNYSIYNVIWSLMMDYVDEDKRSYLAKLKRAGIYTDEVNDIIESIEDLAFIMEEEVNQDIE